MLNLFNTSHHSLICASSEKNLLRDYPYSLLSILIMFAPLCKAKNLKWPFHNVFWIKYFCNYDPPPPIRVHMCTTYKIYTQVGLYSPMGSSLECEARFTVLVSYLVHYVDRQLAMTRWELWTGEVSYSWVSIFGICGVACSLDQGA